MHDGTGDANAGAMIGLALGDAMGAPVEFIDRIPEMVDRYGPVDSWRLIGPLALITDDTQMTLAVARALKTAAGQGLSARTVEPALRAEFVAWLHSPDNNRAPGITCLDACAGLEQGRPWQETSVRGSKGCGANMRVLPVALLRDGEGGVAPGDRTPLAQLTAALTHGHPTALAASDLTARAVVLLRDGVPPDDLPAALVDHGRAVRTDYRDDWLGSLWARPGEDSPGSFIARGYDEALGALARVDSAHRLSDEDDPCAVTGAGWVAEEALATALQCFLETPDDPVRVIRRAAATSGDSDSIACLAGAFAGVRSGLDGWPVEWVQVVEHRDELLQLAAALG